MTSKSIYSQICFVYKWTQLSTGKWYIGSHYSIDAHPNDGYICTSKIVKPMIKENPNDWVRIILETGSAKDVVQLEHELLVCLDAAKSKYSYNEHNGGTKFYKSGPHTGKAAKGVPKTGKAAKGFPNTGGSAKGIPNTGGSAKGVPKTGKTAKGVPKTGKAARGIQRGPQLKSECPHCNISCSHAMLKRWNNNNCKSFNHYTVLGR